MKSSEKKTYCTPLLERGEKKLTHLIIVQRRYGNESCVIFANRVKKINLYFAFNIQPIRASESCLLANFIPSSFSLKQFMKEVGISSQL